MNAGLFWVCLFVALEAAQYTVFGNVLQDADPIRFSVYSTGLICVVAIAVSAKRTPHEVRAAFAAPGLLIGTNLLVAISWAAMLLSLRYIEPAISYTIGAAIMPLTVWALARLNVAGAAGPRNGMERLGLVVLALSACVLSAVAFGGQAGFVRNEQGAALIGAGMAVFEGVIFTIVIILSARLHQRGVGPAAQFGLRFMVFMVLATALFLMREPPAAPPVYSGMWLAVLGAVLIAPPLYALQRAIASAPAMTVSIATAFGPVCIFAAQVVEGRFDASADTLVGILIYSAGAVLAATGAWRAERANRASGG